MDKFLPKKTKYDPSMCNTLLKVASEGGHVAQMCTEMGIRSFDTFYRWLDQYPDFKDAYDESKVISRAFYESLCLQVACGTVENASSSTLAMTMYNKFGDEYKRGTTSEINIGNMNSLEKLDEKKLDEQIARLQRKLELTKEK